MKLINVDKTKDFMLKNHLYRFNIGGSHRAGYISVYNIDTATVTQLPALTEVEPVEEEEILETVEHHREVLDNLDQEQPDVEEDKDKSPDFMPLEDWENEGGSPV